MFPTYAVVIGLLTGGAVLALTSAFHLAYLAALGTIFGLFLRTDRKMRGPVWRASPHRQTKQLPFEPDRNPPEVQAPSECVSNA